MEPRENREEAAGMQHTRNRGQCRMGEIKENQRVPEVRSRKMREKNFSAAGFPPCILPQDVYNDGCCLLGMNL